jgi:hypothetical protein
MTSSAQNRHRIARLFLGQEKAMMPPCALQGTPALTDFGGALALARLLRHEPHA